jgi:hypothetical protein
MHALSGRGRTLHDATLGALDVHAEDQDRRETASLDYPLTLAPSRPSSICTAAAVRRPRPCRPVEVDRTRGTTAGRQE